MIDLKLSRSSSSWYHYYCLYVFSFTVLLQQQASQTAVFVSAQGNVNNICTFTGDNGAEVTFQAGESIHSYKESRCSDSENFPCFCNPSVPGQIECPYCWLPSEDGNLLCAKDGTAVTYTSLAGDLETCDCTVSNAELNVFSTDCRPAELDSQQAGDGDGGGGGGQGSDGGFGGDGGFFFNGNTCLINGVSFARGDSLGFSYDSGCAGPSLNYQCFCNPDLPDQVECPYCYYDVGESDDTICLRDGEIAIIEDAMGQSQTCGCTVPNGGTPSSNCFFAPETANTCVLEAFDGTFQVFAAGESVERARSTRCGSDYPCFCEPSIRGQTWCPYCVFPVDSDTLLCAGNGETVTYTDANTQRVQRCSCQIPFDPSLPPISTCSLPTGNNPSASPEEDNIPEQPGLEPESPPVNVPDNSQFRICEFGSQIFFEGENVGDNFVTRCGSAQDFPCFCNPDNNPPVDCPYCGFALTKENLLCLKNEQIASFVDIYGDEKTCGCEAPITSSTPTENCMLPATEANVCIFRDENGDPFTFNEGEPVDDNLLPLSFCGPNFLCFCDPMAREQLSCPFCVDVDFAGNLICAEANEIIFFQDQNGISQQCFCEVPDELTNSDEPRINCEDTLPPTGSNFPVIPTASPDFAPTAAPISGPSCRVTSNNGETIVVADGASFGSALSAGPCGSTIEWPFICNAAGITQAQQITYPYCEFTNTAFGTTECARDDSVVRFLDDTRTVVDCTCDFSGATPVTECTPVGETPPDESSSVHVKPTAWNFACIITLVLYRVFQN